MAEIPDPATTNWVPIWNPMQPILPEDLGKWNLNPFNAGDYTGSGGMTWTVEASDVASNVYAIIEKVLIWSVVISDSTLSGSPSNVINVAIPPGITPLRPSQVVGTANIGGIWNPMLIIHSGGLTVQIYKFDVSNYTLGQLYLGFQFIIPML